MVRISTYPTCYHDLMFLNLDVTWSGHLNICLNMVNLYKSSSPNSYLRDAMDKLWFEGFGVIVVDKRSGGVGTISGCLSVFLIWRSEALEIV